jgi:predicted kinase
VVEAVPGADVTVVRLRAPIAVIEERLRLREPQDALAWYIDAARELVPRLEWASVEDHVIDNVDISLTDVATRVLAVAEWT